MASPAASPTATAALKTNPAPADKVGFLDKTNKSLVTYFQPAICCFNSDKLRSESNGTIMKIVKLIANVITAIVTSVYILPKMAINKVVSCFKSDAPAKPAEDAAGKTDAKKA